MKKTNISFPCDKFIMRIEEGIDPNNSIQLTEHFTSLKESNSPKISFNPNGNYTGMFDKFDLDHMPTAVLWSVVNMAVEEYVQNNRFLMQGIDPWKVCDIWHLQEYEPGDHYKREHCEHGKDFYDNKRILAWMVYLNNCDGGTRWPTQQYTSEPQIGDVYIWPASWTHSHFGIPSTQKKWIATGWCIFKDPEDEKKMEETVLNKSN